MVVFIATTHLCGELAPRTSGEGIFDQNDIAELNKKI